MYFMKSFMELMFFANFRCLSTLKNYRKEARLLNIGQLNFQHLQHSVFAVIKNFSV